jgi:hypothetical protein
MKKILSLSVCALLTTCLFAQDTPVAPKKKETINLSNRSNDHFVLQLGYTGWAGKPDTINTGGFSKSVNVYFMFDYPFKTNPKLSMAFGAGVGTDQIQFKKTYVGIKDLTTAIKFTNQSDTTHFKKTKLAVAYLEAPIEFRYSSNPATGKGIKGAIGIKVGTLLNAHTRNAKLESSSGSSLNDYILKESSKKFFNKTRLVATGRIGMGHISLYGSYQLTPLFKDALGPVVRPFSVGITLSGL